MAWSLEIHHIDVATGDATLIVAKEDSTHPPTTRTMLIDGGKQGQGITILDYLHQQDVRRVDVVVASHWDSDHCGGLTRLLAMANERRFTSSVVIDRGEQGDVDANGNVMRQHDTFLRFRDAATLLNGRVRITRDVATAGTCNLNAPPQGWSRPDWLLNQEVLWRNNNPNALNAQGGPLPLGDPIPVPQGAPTVRCIAANYGLLDENDQLAIIKTGQGDLENRLCLGFVVTFGNFRYFTGGDLESTQEAVIGRHLNRQNTANGGISAFKVSHHGSAHSTEASFVRRLRAKAAFISVGESANFGGVAFPTQPVITNLQNAQNIRNYYLVACGNEELQYIPDVVEGTPQNGKARVAGGYERRLLPGRKFGLAPKAGDIVLKVDAQQAAQVPATFDVTFWNTNEQSDETNQH